MTKTNTKKTDKPVVPSNVVPMIAAKSEKEAYAAIAAAVLDETKKHGTTQTTLQGLAGFLVKEHGAGFFDQNGSVRHAFGKAFKDNYIKNIIPKAAPGMAKTLENQIGVYKQRVLLYAAKYARNIGTKLSNAQAAELHRIVKAYGPKDPKGKTEPRSFKARVIDEVSSLYKAYMKIKDNNFGGLGPIAIANIEAHLVGILKDCGKDPARVIADKD